MTESEQLRTLRENIRFLTERGTLSLKQREICIEQILDRLLPADSPQEINDAYRALCRQFPELTAEDRAAFFLRYATLLSGRGELSPEKTFFPADEVADPHFRGRIALVKNRFNEQAYQMLSPSVTGAKEYHVSSFSEACEEVANMRCEYGVLPVENTRDGRLFGFYGMLDRYELKICAVTSLETDDLRGSTRYALIGRALPARIPKSSQWNLEYSVALPVGEFPHDLLSVCDRFSAKLLKVDSLPVQYDDQLHRFYFTFQVSKDAAVGYHLYCTQVHTRYTPIGLYPIL